MAATLRRSTWQPSTPQRLQLPSHWFGNREKAAMNAHDRIHEKAAAAEKAADSAIDALQTELDTATDTLEGALRLAQDDVHEATGRPSGETKQR